MTGAPVNRWDDLRPRVVSAVVMVAVGAAEIWLGGPSFAVLVILMCAAMVWELATITAPARRNTPLTLAALAGGALAGAIWLPDEEAAVLLLLPALALALTPRRDRRLTAAWGAVVMVAGFGFVALRNEAGTPAILWLVMVVIASDVAGYFVGRIMGGPKFWPRISPKKTWSGTVAGWVGAAGVGLGFVWGGYAPWSLVVLSAVIAFAGQMGDIGESWLKRRAGVKDSSSLIPGHGGLLDRFDALTGAAVVVMALGLILDLPLPMPLAGGN
jgi:phosphatidate cytidylyltransferase